MTNLTETIESPKLKLSVDLTQKVEKEIALPYFANYGSMFIKVLENKTTIVVKTYSFTKSIEITPVEHYDSSLVMNGCNPITEQEFNEAYETALTHIQNQTL